MFEGLKRWWNQPTETWEITTHTSRKDGYITGHYVWAALFRGGRLISQGKGETTSEAKAAALAKAAAGEVE